MLGVTIGNHHTFHDLGLLLKGYPKITPPKAKVRFVDVPGADGALNVSRVLTGFMLYERRTISMEFNILEERDLWPEIHSSVMDELHGLELEIILDDDPEFFYTGIVSVDDYDPQNVTSGVRITADVEPYKTRIEPTKRSFDVSGSLAAKLITMRKPVCPVITASAAMQMIFGGRTYSLAVGKNTFPDVILRSGADNSFTFKGDGSVTLEYREGRF